MNIDPEINVISISFLKNIMEKFTTLNGETILVNLTHVVAIEKTKSGTQLIFDSNITDPGAYEQKNYLLVKERFEYVMYKLSDDFDPDTRIPKRFD